MPLARLSFQSPRTPRETTPARGRVASTRRLAGVGGVGLLAPDLAADGGGFFDFWGGSTGGGDWFTNTGGGADPYGDQSWRWDEDLPVYTGGTGGYGGSSSGGSAGGGGAASGSGSASARVQAVLASWAQRLAALLRGGGTGYRIPTTGPSQTTRPVQTTTDFLAANSTAVYALAIGLLLLVVIKRSR